jgi:hypothetical protein
MVTAKFHIVGENSAWLKTRAQEEIQSAGLEGSVVNAGKNTLAVIVEGEKKKIHTMYKNLVESSPSEAQYTDLEFGVYRDLNISVETDLAKNIQIMIELLKEIEKNTRRINQKIDGITNQQRGDYPSWLDSEEKDEEAAEEAVGGFASMFGD